MGCGTLKSKRAYFVKKRMVKSKNAIEMFQ